MLKYNSYNSKQKFHGRKSGIKIIVDVKAKIQ